MKTATTLGVFALGLAVAFGGGAALGHAIGSGGHASTKTQGSSHGDSAGGGHGDSDGGGMDMGSDKGAAIEAVGLSVSQDGYGLQLVTSTLTAGTPGTLSFNITDPQGRPLNSYTPTHEKDLHLIVVRRDLSSFQHVHPTRDAEGLWSIPLTLAEPGAYKVFTDFAPKGRTTALVLGTDLTVAGGYAPQPLPAVSRTAAVDGYTVTLDGDLTAGKDSKVVLTVNKDGRAVSDLQPYLGAFGHLVAIRPGDLAYLHVHPEDGKPAPGITFTVEVPTAGSYRLFLDFKYSDKVRTAAFTVTAQRS